MNINGLLYCAQYAFPPNLLGYCGPAKSNELLGYRSEQIADKGLNEILVHFETLYPYLTLIAYENNIRDPFDPRVVEAYWIGNSLLHSVTQKKIYSHFADTLALKKKLKQQDFKWLIGKIPQGSLPTHAFHVLNIFVRTGHQMVHHTLETMDNCRIGWGRIVSRSMNYRWVEVETQALIFQDGKLTLSTPIIKKIFLPLTSGKNNKYKIGSNISFHWHTACGFLSTRQIQNLKKYTQLAIDLANKTI